MGHYPFTAFNAATLLILGLTLVVAWRRMRRPSLTANWPLLYYAATAGYTFGFSGGLNPYWVAAGVACGLAIRCGLYPAQVRWMELVPLAYIAWRSVGLILMW